LKPKVSILALVSAIGLSLFFCRRNSFVFILFFDLKSMPTIIRDQADRDQVALTAYRHYHDEESSGTQHDLSTNDTVQSSLRD
jgi:hypothetical protein